MNLKPEVTYHDNPSRDLMNQIVSTELGLAKVVGNRLTRPKKIGGRMQFLVSFLSQRALIWLNQDKIKKI